MRFRSGREGFQGGVRLPPEQQPVWATSAQSLRWSAGLRLPTRFFDGFHCAYRLRDAAPSILELTERPTLYGSRPRLRSQPAWSRRSPKRRQIFITLGFMVHRDRFSQQPQVVVRPFHLRGLSSRGTRGRHRRNALEIVDFPGACVTLGPRVGGRGPASIRTISRA